MPFAGGKLDRESGKRNDAAYIAEQLASPNTELIIFQNAKPFFAKDANAPLRLLASALPQFGKIKLGPIYLGKDNDSIPLFAIELSASFDVDNSILQGMGEFAELRQMMMRISHEDLAMLGVARSLFDWHGRHGYCANCGASSDIAEAGWKRICPDCNTEHFPRTDPVAIMLVVHDGKCLLGNSPRFPRAFYSCLAGFIEAGESIEEACRREVFEEVGVMVSDCEIIGNQPWPFPSQLMIGLIATATTTEISIDAEEIADARWFSKSQIAEMLDGGTLIDSEQFFGPPKVAIAYHIMQHWLESLA
ncbi:MAG: NAD+ diphosphatase [Hyphomonadaceae bacterium]|nr:MAG: NAD+ diphosphatase [Hyphomonadaceae bacterium]